jgi:hypothetical protein
MRRVNQGHRTAAARGFLLLALSSYDPVLVSSRRATKSKRASVKRAPQPRPESEMLELSWAQWQAHVREGAEGGRDSPAQGSGAERPTEAPPVKSWEPRELDPAQLKQVRKSEVGPEVGPTAACYTCSCVPTIPAQAWANLNIFMDQPNTFLATGQRPALHDRTPRGRRADGGRVPLGVPPAAAGDPSARSPCRVAPPLIHFIPDSRKNR